MKVWDVVKLAGWTILAMAVILTIIGIICILTGVITAVGTIFLVCLLAGYLVREAWYWLISPTSRQ